MEDCNSTVDLIYDNENIGGSLTKINNNFNALQTLACDIEKTLDKEIQIRTLFYYGPNSATDSGSGMNSGQTSYPSFDTIENFVNLDLQLPSISEVGDIVYIVYQKTGWSSTNILTPKSGSGSVPYSRQVVTSSTRKIGIGRYVTTYSISTQTFYAGYSWYANINDQYNNYAPVLVVYKLNFKNGTNYKVEIDPNNIVWPKFIRASTNSTPNWNNPTTWSIY
jgi:hypothetical protein